MKTAIVLDKSFVQGASAAKMHALADEYHLLMSDALFYELISNPQDRRNCFIKFPQRDNPVDLIMHVGGHLKKEIETRSPSGKPSRNIEPIRFEFNKALRSEGYELPEDAAEAVAEQYAELQGDVRRLVARAIGMKRLFPQVFIGSDKQRLHAREKATELILEDTKALLQFYSKLQAPPRKRGFPRRKYVTEDWALFRWLQVQMLFALDLSWRHGENLKRPLTRKQTERLEHDVLDAQYMLLGVLEGGFATQETKLQSWFRALRPDGLLFSVDA